MSPGAFPLSSNPRLVTWLICEAGDRWYRGICRFAPQLFDATVRWRLERLAPDGAATVLTRAKVLPRDLIILWEISTVPALQSVCLDTMASIRSEAPATLQLVWLPSTAPPSLVLASQEAGAVLVLADLWSLPRLGKLFASHLKLPG